MGNPQPAPQPTSLPQWWRIGRASLGFILDTFATTRGPGDILDPLLVTVIVDCNVAPINQDAELSRRYATLDAPPPDELRRPVSINAVAASLRLPYETVRRRVNHLVTSGALSITPRGVLAPTGSLANPFYAITAAARYERTRRFYFDLKALGALADIDPRPPEAPRYASAPVRLVNRLLSEYTLRVIDALMLRLGDPVTGLILLEMGYANFEHLTVAERSHEGPMPDDLRRPIAALALARRVRLPPETVRRHVATLEKLGFCRRVKGGLLATLEQLARADGEHGLANNMVNVHRLFSRCASLGALAWWEDEAKAGA